MICTASIPAFIRCDFLQGCQFTDIIDIDALVAPSGLSVLRLKLCNVTVSRLLPSSPGGSAPCSLCLRQLPESFSIRQIFDRRNLMLRRDDRPQSGCCGAGWRCSVLLNGISFYVMNTSRSVLEILFSTEMIRLNVSSRRNYSVDDLFDRLIIESDVNDVKERQFLMTERRSETCITVCSMQPTLEILSLVLTCHPVTLWSPHTAN